MRLAYIALCLHIIFIALEVSLPSCIELDPFPKGVELFFCMQIHAVSASARHTLFIAGAGCVPKSDINYRVYIPAL
ncbi:hypothetical protein ASD52_05555 [Ensifer sp. Root142]|jgi:hypothetical protein|nr:hypothetical protein ASD52_05555 [Ensifer sp. Root142]OMQ45120.1 hypothetical protein BKP54_09390 [Ensifer sp. 1H6]PSS66772.1 hypothetical protein C6558_01695 [Ensifer sp. NM-2]